MHAMLVLVLIALVVAVFFIPILERLANARTWREEEMRLAEERRRHQFHD